MPTDDILWASIILTGFAIGIGYFIRSWARSVSVQLKHLSESAGTLESHMISVRSDVGDLTRLLSDKIGAVDADAMMAHFAVGPARRVRKKMVVKLHG